MKYTSSYETWKVPLVKDLTDSTLPFIREDNSIREAIEIFIYSKSEALPIVNSYDRPLGIVTGKSILKGLTEGSGDELHPYILTDNIVTVSPYNSILNIVSLPYSYYLVVNDDKRLIGMMTHEDILKALKMHISNLENVKRSADILNIVLDSAYEGIVVVDENAIIKEFNEAYSRFVGVPKHEAIGRHVKEVIDNTNLHNTVKTGIPERGVLQYIQGQPMIVHRIPLWNEGRVVGAIGMLIFEGVSELYQIYDRVHKKLRIKNEFTEKISSNRLYIEKEVSLDQMIGNSKEIVNLKRIVRKVSQTDVTVLITGESGTGKELVARSIHQLGKRAQGPFVSVNCAAIPEELFESELFGYEEGAFTGAKKEGKPGKFELAEGGTLFLDEIGDMPLSLQTKLLRVLQEKEFEKVGGTSKRRMKARIVTATNKDLKKLVKEGKFREDLYFRINVIEVHIPPLRKRVEDIPLLIAHYLNKICEKHSFPKKDIAPEAMMALRNYQWHGNIRELINIVERLVVLTEGNRINLEHLPEEVIRNNVQWRASDEQVQVLKKSKKDFEEQIIKEALDSTDGNKTKAAKLLGIHRTTLYQKLKKYNL